MGQSQLWLHETIFKTKTLVSWIVKLADYNISRSPNRFWLFFFGGGATECAYFMRFETLKCVFDSCVSRFYSVDSSVLEKAIKSFILIYNIIN